jgi:hypothetical protein
MNITEDFVSGKNGLGMAQGAQQSNGLFLQSLRDSYCTVLGLVCT